MNHKIKPIYWMAPFVLVLAVILSLHQHNAKTRSTFLEEKIKAELGQLDGKSNDEIQAALDEIIEDGSMSISISMNPVFLSGDSEGDLRIENHPNNHYSQRVSITLDETGQEVYQSGTMPVNSHIDADRLNIVLPQGQYPATAIFTAYDDADREIGQAAAKILLTILS